MKVKCRECHKRIDDTDAYLTKVRAMDLGGWTRSMGMVDGGIVISTMYYCKACCQELYYQFHETLGMDLMCYVCGKEGPWGEKIRIFGGPLCDSCIAAGEYDHSVVDNQAWERSKWAKQNRS